MNVDDTEVVHLLDEHQFVIDMGQARASLSYDLFDDRINFTHTFVPTGLRGQGLAEKLVRHGLSWARSERLAIETSCWYVQKFL